MPIQNVLTNLANKAEAVRNGYRPSATKFSVQTPHCARGASKLDRCQTEAPRVSFTNMLPCPYCRGTRLELLDTNHPYFQVLCQACGMTGPEFATTHLAVTVWNAIPRKS